MTLTAPRPSLARVMAPLCVAVCLSLFGDLTLYAVLPTQRAQVELSLAAVGVMLGVNRLIRIPGNPLIGALYDRYRHRRLFQLGMTLGVLSTLGYGVVRGFWPFLLARLAWGLGWTLINVGGMVILLDISSAENRGRLAGLYNTAMLLGFALGPLAGGFLVDALGFRAAMRLYAGVTALGWLAALLLPETATAPAPTTSGWQLRRVWEAWREVWRTTPGLPVILGVLLIVQFAGEGIALSTINLLLEQRFGAVLTFGAVSVGVASASGILLAGRSLFAGLTGAPAGHLSDRGVGRKTVLAGSLIAGMIGFGILALATSPGAIVLGMLVGAISSGAGLAVLTAMLGDRAAAGRAGVLMGVFATAGDIGSALGPFLAFALVENLPLQWAYWLCALTFLVALALLQPLRAA